MIRFQRLLTLFLCLGAIGILGGCEVLAPSEDERLGFIQFYGDTTVVSIPASVVTDSTFAVRFHTFGGGCVGAGRTGVAQSGPSATITPFDTHSGANVCDDVLIFLQHEGLLRFTTPGPATVVVRGGSEPDGGVLEVRFTVLVEER